ncbi:MAG: hypothetical protein Q8Q29_04300 [Actinomycetota bacterium]|nr:hypothetical protein [Actinomycetota bacterium]
MSPTLKGDAGFRFRTGALALDAADLVAGALPDDVDDRLAATGFGGGLTVPFLDAGFLAAGFLAADFLAEPLLAAGRFGAGCFAAGFLAVAFDAVAFLEVAAFDDVVFFAVMQLPDGGTGQCTAGSVGPRIRTQPSATGHQP